MKRSLRTRSLHDSSVSDYDINKCIEGLLRGEPCDEVPPRLAKGVIATLTQMRKDCILERRDGMASKIEEVLGEMQHGPKKFQYDTPENPNNIRNRSLRFTSNDTFQNDRLQKTGTSLIQGASLASVDIPTRLAVTPVLKTKRVLEVSKRHYPLSRSIDTTIENCIEYEVDSRRLGPRLLKIQELEKKLSAAQSEYSEARNRAIYRKQRFEEIQEAAHLDHENRLKDDLLQFGSHTPTTLPVEYSKFSNKVLDTRVREYKSATIRQYEDADALHNEVIKKEREELDTMSERFQRSFKLQRQNKLNSQEQQRKSFETFWDRKKQKELSESTAEVTKLRMSVDHLQKQLDEAKGAAGGELSRIRNNERIKASTPVASRPRGMRISAT
ncbi:hypothetical protein TRFO_12401 [Tritrichomonas foetus]|uniref:Uncharacterized protein n=1 Tax=Tritrichomonas foetus TaxID=1144522 RepID=A0A1J4L663_9EUKA|nr:hypothetical protein TRFO_12401 [Tritrichomonas foetus]|eukprot:OHT17438.1 hypothetical protein TRFO_12401 [Tritrichomonas foetus]